MLDAITRPGARSTATVRALLGALATVGAIVTFATPAAAQLVYVVDATQRFGTIDIATGAFHQIGLTMAEGSGGLAQGPNGSLLSLTFSGKLIAIDPLTGVTEVVGPTGLGDCSTPESLCGPKAASALVGVGGTIYATDFQGMLYTIDPLTGLATPVAQTGLPAVPFRPGFPTPEGTLPFYDEALFPVGGQLFATFDAAVLDFGTGDITPVVAPHLYRIDPATGQTTLVASTAVGLGAAIVVNGTTYAFHAQTGQVVTLGLTTGQIAPVSTYGAPTEFVVTGAAVVPTATPEPASLGLVGVGVLAIAAHRRRARRA